MPSFSSLVLMFSLTAGPAIASRGFDSVSVDSIGCAPPPTRNIHAMSLQKRYLELLRKALVNELYLENDARALYVFSSLQAGRGVEGDVLRNISARRPELVAQLAKDREEGSP